MKTKNKIHSVSRITWLLLIYICSQVIVYATNREEYCSHTGHLYQNSISSEELNKYDITYYKLELDVSDTSTYLEGFTSIKARCVSQNLSDIVFELSNVLEIDSVLVNGEIRNFIHKNNLITISVPEININDFFETIVFYRGNGENSAWISGILNKKNSKWSKNITYTLSEPFGAKDWFVCKQVLSDKADSVAVNIIVDDYLMAGSNGLLTNVTPLPNNKLRYEWKSNYPINYYLISLAVSDYRDYSFYTKLNKNNDSVLVQNFIYNDSIYFQENKSDIDETGKLLVLFSEMYGIYPFYEEKYGHCVAPLGGGMENQTMTSLSSFNFDLVAHELAHQWFGDYVTCASWQDIWINEGFASYSEYLAREFLKSKEEASVWLGTAYAIVKGDEGGSVYIPENEIRSESRIFSQRLTYKKGAAIIHMLRYEINNDDLFFSALRSFLSKYKESVATGNDLLDILNQVTGDMYDWFFDQWYYGSGIPHFDILWKQKMDTLIINSIQSTSGENNFFRTSLEFKINFEDNSDTIVRVFQDLQNKNFSITIPEKLISSVEIDPGNNILKTVLSNSKIVDPELVDNYFYAQPNPFDSKITLNFKKFTEHQVTIIDSLGNVKDRLWIDDKRQKINTTGYSSGIYFIIVESNRSTYAQKVIKY